MLNHLQPLALAGQCFMPLHLLSRFPVWWVFRSLDVRFLSDPRVWEETEWVCCQTHDILLLWMKSEKQHDLRKPRCAAVGLKLCCLSGGRFLDFKLDFILLGWTGYPVSVCLFSSSKSSLLRLNNNFKHQYFLIFCFKLLILQPVLFLLLKDVVKIFASVIAAKSCLSARLDNCCKFTMSTYHGMTNRQFL